MGHWSHHRPRHHSCCQSYQEREIEDHRCIHMCTTCIRPSSHLCYCLHLHTVGHLQLHIDVFQPSSQSPSHHQRRRFVLRKRLDLLTFTPPLLWDILIFTQRSSLICRSEIFSVRLSPPNHLGFAGLHSRCNSLFSIFISTWCLLEVKGAGVDGDGWWLLELT